MPPVTVPFKPGARSPALPSSAEQGLQRLYPCRIRPSAVNLTAPHDRLKPYRRLQLRARSRVATSLAEHQEIMDAIFMGDGAKAERLLKDHVLIQGERLADFIASFDAAAA